jgi:hypothetical protein
VKRPLVACPVVCAWVSELSASRLNRQLCAFNMSIPLTNTSSNEVNLSSTLNQERLTCILFMFFLCVHPRASRAAQIAIFLSPSLWHLTASLSSSPGATKLEPVGPALLISAVKKGSAIL